MNTEEVDTKMSQIPLSIMSLFVGLGSSIQFTHSFCSQQSAFKESVFYVSVINFEVGNKTLNGFFIFWFYSYYSYSYDYLIFQAYFPLFVGWHCLSNLVLKSCVWFWTVCEGEVETTI